MDLVEIHVVDAQGAKAVLEGLADPRRSEIEARLGGKEALLAVPARSAFPTRPSLVRYASAVSTRVMPESIAARTLAIAVDSSILPIPPPMGHAPNPSTGTIGPSFPRVLCSSFAITGIYDSRTRGGTGVRGCQRAAPDAAIFPLSSLRSGSDAVRARAAAK